MNIIDLMIWKKRRGGGAHTVSGVPPLSFTSDGSALLNYRVYGNEINNNSVGDKTANQWSSSLIGDTHVSPTTGLPEFYGGRCGIVTPISITGESSLFITFDSEKTGVRCMYSVLSEGVLVRRQTAISSGNTINVSDGEELYIAFYRSANDLVPDDITNIMLNSGSAALPYEPYGYRLPLTVNSSTVNIYLSAPLSKTNDTADYIDYADQKRYNADGTSADVTLPALPTISGTNILSVGTTVQPSQVMVKGKIQEVGA